MSASILRAAGIASGLAMLTVVGAWVGFVAPAHARVASARSQQAELERMLRDLDIDHTVPELSARLTSLRDLSQAIQERSTHALAQAELYGSMSSLAESHGLTIDRIDPRDTSAARPTKDQGPATASLTCTIALRGPFQQVLSFVNDIEHAQGLVRVVSARLQPAGDALEPACTLTLETRHVALAPAPRTENRP